MILLLIGCNNTNDSKGDNNTIGTNDRPSDTEENSVLDPSNKPIIEYIESDEKGIGERGTERNFFESDEALAIAQALSSRTDVRHAHVATSDTQVVAFVLLKDYQNHHIAEDLEEEVRKISPDKDIYIYTDKVHYNRVEDLKSSMRARQIGNNIERFIERYFNVEIED